MATQSLVRNFLEPLQVKTRGNKVTYLFDLVTLWQVGAKQWSRQRPADEMRVKEIREWIEKEQDVSGVLSMAWHPTENLIVYDGQHRWRALLGLEKFPSKILVEIMWDVTEADIIASFQNINRCVSVPELYTESAISADSVRTDIMDYVAMTCANHKEFLSTTDKPNRPHFNRDKLTDELFGLWRDEFQQEVAFLRIAGALTLMNEEYDTNPMSVPREATRRHPRIYDKCSKHHFWLFAQTGHINTEHLRATLKRI